MTVGPPFPAPPIGKEMLAHKCRIRANLKLYLILCQNVILQTFITIPCISVGKHKRWIVHSKCTA